MPVLIIGWRVYDNLPEEEQKEFALVERYRTDYFYECYEYENAKGNKTPRAKVYPNSIQTTHFHPNPLI